MRIVYCKEYNGRRRAASSRERWAGWQGGSRLLQPPLLDLLERAVSIQPSGKNIYRNGGPYKTLENEKIHLLC